MTNMHLSLRVSDLGHAVAFYQAFFGAPVHKQRDACANFLLADPPLKFALTQAPVEPGSGSLDHLGFQVDGTAQLEAVKERLQSAGLATFDETDTVCCYARQDKVWVHDPDGNEWEIYLLTDEMEDERSTAEEAPMTLRPAHRCCG